MLDRTLTTTIIESIQYFHHQHQIQRAIEAS